MDEQLLCRLWRAQRFDRADLRTDRGEAVEVVYRGRHQRSAGPDFRGAALVIGGELRHGDVEVHVRAAGWSAHRHERNRRYDDVILHVVYQADGQAARTSRGETVPCLPLAGRLGGPESWADLAGPSEEDCLRRLAALDDAALGKRLDALGDERLRQKAAALEAELAVADAEQVLYERLLEACGYAGNRQPFLELARRLPVASLYGLAHRRALEERIQLCESLLFGVAGLLPSRRPGGILDWDGSEYVESLERTWAAFGGDWHAEAMDPASWSLGVRPLNSPPRRISAMAHYLGRHLAVGPVESLRAGLRFADARRSVRTLLDGLIVSAPGSYWAWHSDFGRPAGASEADLLARSRALEALVNVYLPLALAGGCGGDREIEERALRTYAATPRLAWNEVTRWLVGEVIGPARAGVVRTARRQQGLHLLFQAGCDQRRCEACPLLDEAL